MSTLQNIKYHPIQKVLPQPSSFAPSLSPIAVDIDRVLLSSIPSTSIVLSCVVVLLSQGGVVYIGILYVHKGDLAGEGYFLENIRGLIRSKMFQDWEKCNFSHRYDEQLVVGVEEDGAEGGEDSPNKGKNLLSPEVRESR